MKKQRFTGPMGQWMQKHLALRHSLGFIYRTAMYTLDAFDQYLLLYFPKCQTISRAMVIDYINSLIKATPQTKSQYIGDLRQFCRFMFQHDDKTYIPEKGLVKHKNTKINYHIFTEEEIIKLIKQAKKLGGKHKILPETYVLIIGLLWTTGMRIGEIVNLKIEDINFVNGIITIKQTKFFKSRLIPLSPSTTEAMVSYKKLRANCRYSEEAGTPLFFNRQGKPCITATTPRTIRGLMIKAGIKTIQGETPRVHDIRHSFATRWMVDFYQSNKDPTSYLPVLATYMGHANISNTQVYLHPSLELLNLAGQQLQAYIHSTSGEKDETRK